MISVFSLPILWRSLSNSLKSCNVTSSFTGNPRCLWLRCKLQLRTGFTKLRRNRDIDTWSDERNNALRMHFRNVQKSSFLSFKGWTDQTAGSKVEKHLICAWKTDVITVRSRESQENPRPRAIECPRNLSRSRSCLRDLGLWAQYLSKPISRHFSAVKKSYSTPQGRPAFYHGQRKQRKSLSLVIENNLHTRSVWSAIRHKSDTLVPLNNF